MSEDAEAVLPVDNHEVRGLRKYPSKGMLLDQNLDTSRCRSQIMTEPPNGRSERFGRMLQDSDCSNPPSNKLKATWSWQCGPEAGLPHPEQDPRGLESPPLTGPTPAGRRDLAAGDASDRLGWQAQKVPIGSIRDIGGDDLVCR